MGSVEAFFDDISVEHIESKVTQVADYYPFGMQIKQTSTDVTSPLANKYLYNGKELQEETGWYDYGARMYDASLGRWHMVDPLSRNYYQWSPYHYTYDNPIKYIDPDGREIWISTGFRKLKYEDGKLYTKKGKDVTHKAYKKDGKTFKNNFLGKSAGGLDFMKNNGMSDMISDLQKSDNVFTIKSTTASTQYMPDDAKNAAYNQNMDTNNPHPHQTSKYYFGEKSTARGSGGTLYFNPNGSLETITQNGVIKENNPTAHLAHEFTHAFDSDNGDLDFRYVFGGAGVGVQRKEARAMYYANHIRIAQGKGYLRIQYDSTQPAKVVKDGKPISVNPPKKMP